MKKRGGVTYRNYKARLNTSLKLAISSLLLLYKVFHYQQLISLCRSFKNLCTEFNQSLNNLYLPAGEDIFFLASTDFFYAQQATS